MPDPMKTPEKCDSVKAANAEVLSELKQSGGKRKRGTYSHYDADQRAKIGRWASDHGNASAMKRYAKDYGHNISESSVRSIKKTIHRRM